jgi:hypothetical protein
MPPFLLVCYMLAFLDPPVHVSSCRYQFVMAVRVRFSAVDEQSVNGLLQQYLDNEDDDEPFIAKDTKAERYRIWNDRQE